MSKVIQSSDISELDDIEATIKNPDIYMGELNNVSKRMYTFDGKNVNIEAVQYNTGLLKIFDEILTNAADNLERQGSGIKNISVNITDDSISVYNDGKTIPIEKYNNTEIWIPELIFTHFRAGSNFKGKNKTTGGKNGIGSKLTCVYSTEFEIEIVNNGKYYSQLVQNNCRKINPPTIQSVSPKSSEEYIMITFKPDFKLLKCGPKISSDNKKVLYKRVHDLTHLPLTINLNDKQLPRLSWSQYVNQLVIKDNSNSSASTSTTTAAKGKKATKASLTPSSSLSNPLLFTYETNRWKVAFGLSSCDKLKQISYVNNICTYDGGEHVKYIINQIFEYIKSKCPDILSASSSSSSASSKSNASSTSFTSLSSYKNILKSNLFVVVSAIICDPMFKSQSKETLTTKPNAFGSTCIIPNQILQNFVNDSNIISIILSSVNSKTKIKTKIHKGKITSIDKLVEANKAGTAEGTKCTLFLCEGNSAKTMCDKGIGILGHDYYGCYPLRGKVLNALNSGENKYDANKELTDVKNIIGLEDGKEYTSVKGLRYGKVVCVKDADADGSSIMGLIINFFQTKFPSLLQIDGFFSEFISPMIKVVYNPIDTRKRKVIPFYNEVEYKEFIKNISQSQDKAAKKFSVEFIKGLATNVDEDVREYFTHYSDNVIKINFDDNYDEWIDMAFNKKRANDRKIWLTTITPNTFLPRHKGKPITAIDFIRSDLVLFSYEDCERSIPSVIDGLKPTQRKIMYALFKMGNRGFNKMKVFQLGGLVANRANYHHGESSMNETIIRMAQNYPTCGNNIPLLKAFGQFGSRVENGDDAGAPRYIACALDKIARMIFPSIDDSLMTLKEEDNKLVEPYYYAPIIPMILVNGAKGIGTGWSTDIPSFNPFEIIDFVKAKILDLDEEMEEQNSNEQNCNDETGTDNEQNGNERVNSTRSISGARRKSASSTSSTTTNTKASSIVQSSMFPSPFKHFRINSFYKDFIGKIVEVKNEWKYYGVIEKLSGNTFRVSELPIRYSTSKFISRLNYLAELGELDSIRSAKSKTEKLDELNKKAKSQHVEWKPTEIIETFENRSTVEHPNFIIIFRNDITVQQAIEVLKLYTSIKSTNMVAFDSNIMIQKYSNIYDIVNEWYNVRYTTYELRLKKIIEDIKFQLKLISNKYRFIDENIKKIIDVKNIPKIQIVKTLEERKYDKMPNKGNKSNILKSSNDSEEDMSIDADENDDETNNPIKEEELSFDYLLNMKIYTLTKEKYEELKNKEKDLQLKLQEYENTCVEELWVNELDELKNALIQFYKD